MKKRFVIENLCCANCAAKMEDKIQKLSRVQEASINFLTQKLTIEASDGDFEEVLAQAEKIISKIEPDCRLVR